MEQRYATSPEHVPGMDTAELRTRYLVQNLFAADEINAVYTHHDRVVLVGVSPTTKALELETFPEIRSDFFLDHREAGIVNVGGYVASVTCIVLIGLVLDHVAPGGPATYDVEAFRKAMSVQYLVWALGLAMMWHYRRRTHDVVLADDDYAHLRAGVSRRRTARASRRITSRWSSVCSIRPSALDTTFWETTRTSRSSRPPARSTASPMRAPRSSPGRTSGIPVRGTTRITREGR